MTRFGWMLIATALLLPAPAFAQKGETAKVVDIHGVLLGRDNDVWRPIAPGKMVPDGNTIIALFSADLVSANDAVGVKLVSDVGVFGPLPALESAVRVRGNVDADLDLEVERGIVVVTNRKKEGAARILLRSRGNVLTATLKEPGAKLGIDVYGRHAPGLASLAADNPALFVFLLVMEGSVKLSSDNKSIALKAPPGPALLRWDSILKEPKVEHLDKIPEWVQKNAEEKKMFLEMSDAFKSGDKLGLLLRLKELLSDNKGLGPKIAITTLGALDQLTILFKEVGDSKHSAVREQAILVLRSWLGREPGQIQRLKDLMTSRGFTVPQAESIIHLLIGFDEHEIAQPATYQLLIENLKHSRVPVRELAHWHLVRLAPAGRSIPFNAAGTPEEIETAVNRWRELIPPGKLPSRQ